MRRPGTPTPVKTSVTPQASTHIETQHNSENARVHNGPAIYQQFPLQLSPDAANKAATKTRHKIFAWLSTLTFSAIHDDIQKAIPVHEQQPFRINGRYSGQSLLESDALDRWREGTIRKLWYYGTRKNTALRCLFAKLTQTL